MADNDYKEMIHSAEEIDRAVDLAKANATEVYALKNYAMQVIQTELNALKKNKADAETVEELKEDIEKLNKEAEDIYKKSEVDEKLNDKVEKIEGKGLSANDFSDEYKNKINKNAEDLENTYSKSEVDEKIGDKVDKIEGKGLSTNDFDNKYKSKVDDTYSKSEVDSKFKDKVDKVEGKGLSTNDFTDDYQNKIHDAYTKAVESTSEVEKLKSSKADKSALDATNETVATNQKNLQGQIDSLVLESGGDSNAEVVQARVGSDGTIHDTLKSRIDSTDKDVSNLQENIIKTADVITEDYDFFPGTDSNKIASDRLYIAEIGVNFENYSTDVEGAAVYSYQGVSAYDYIEYPVFMSARDELGSFFVDSNGAIIKAFVNMNSVSGTPNNVPVPDGADRFILQCSKATPLPYLKCYKKNKNTGNDIYTSISFDGCKRYNGFINENDKWVSHSKTTCVLVPVVGNRWYKIVANKHKQTRYAFLSSLITGSGEPPFAVWETGRFTIEPNESKTVQAPNNAKYLYLYETDGCFNFLPNLYYVGNSVLVNLGYGALSDCEIRNQNKEMYYHGTNFMKAVFNLGDFFSHRRTDKFIKAKGYVNFDSVPVGVLYEYDNRCSFIASRKIEKNNILNNATEYIKIHVIQTEAESSVTWTQGNFEDETKNDVRISSEAISLSDIDAFVLNDYQKIMFRFFDSNDELLASSYGYYGHFVNVDMIKQYFSPNDESLTFDDVAYIRVIVGFQDDTPISIIDAPKAYKYGENQINSVTISSYSEFSEAFNKNKYSTTNNILYPTKTNEDSELYYSKMLLKLPKSYSSTGKPTKLIFFKTGSRGFQNIETSNFFYDAYINYWVDEGYAVMDCHGGTSKYPTNDSFGMPTNLASISAAWNYLINNYNIDPTGLYISAKSLGGYTAHQLIFNRNIPVKAAALLAPAIDNKRYCFGYYRFQRENFAADAGLEGDLSVLQQGNDTTSISNTVQFTDEFRTLVKGNISQLTGYMPMVSGVVNKTIDELLALDPEDQNSYHDVVRVVTVPTRYWVAKDDVDTPYNIADNFVRSAQNGNSPVSMRTMPSGTGGHHSVDNSENAPKTTITTRLGVTYTDFPVAWVEALNFMERY